MFAVIENLAELITFVFMVVPVAPYRVLQAPPGENPGLPGRLLRCGRGMVPHNADERRGIGLPQEVDRVYFASLVHEPDLLTFRVVHVFHCLDGRVGAARDYFLVPSINEQYTALGGYSERWRIIP